MGELLIRIDTGYACAGIIVNEFGVVIKTAPIFSWMKGKKWESIKSWDKIKEFQTIKIQMYDIFEY